MHAQTIEAAEWWARERGERTASWITNYQQSVRARHRDVIARLVGAVAPTSVLELGCHCGPNLVRLAQDYPGIRELVGIDANADAITEGTRWMAQLRLESRVTLAQGRLPQAISALPDRSVDVVLTCYALAYVAPGDLDAVLWEMGRVARTAVVIAEPMTIGIPGQQKRSLSGYVEWAHNYLDASHWIGTWRGCTLQMTPIDPPVDQLANVLVVRRDEPSGNTP